MPGSFPLAIKSSNIQETIMANREKFLMSLSGDGLVFGWTFVNGSSRFDID